MEMQRKKQERGSGKKDPTELDRSSCLGLGEQGREGKGGFNFSSWDHLERVATAKRKKRGSRGCGSGAAFGHTLPARASGRGLQLWAGAGEGCQRQEWPPLTPTPALLTSEVVS